MTKRRPYPGAFKVFSEFFFIYKYEQKTVHAKEINYESTEISR